MAALLALSQLVRDEGVVPGMRPHLGSCLDGGATNRGVARLEAGQRPQVDDVPVVRDARECVDAHQAEHLAVGFVSCALLQVPKGLVLRRHAGLIVVLAELGNIFP
jgi:hypothetical protein